MSSDYDDFVDELPVLGDEEWGALLSGAAGNATTATATTTRAETSSTGPGTQNANTSGAPAEPPPQTVEDGAASDSESTDYGDDDIFDSTFLQAVDALERGLTQAESGTHMVALKPSADSLSRPCSTSYYYAAGEWPWRGFYLCECHHW